VPLNSVCIYWVIFLKDFMFSTFGNAVYKTTRWTDVFVQLWNAQNISVCPPNNATGWWAFSSPREHSGHNLGPAAHFSLFLSAFPHALHKSSSILCSFLPISVRRFSLLCHHPASHCATVLSRATIHLSRRRMGGREGLCLRPHPSRPSVERGGLRPRLGLR
jgi:hypothetical protein